MSLFFHCDYSSLFCSVSRLADRLLCGISSLRASVCNSCCESSLFHDRVAPSVDGLFSFWRLLSWFRCWIQSVWSTAFLDASVKTTTPMSHFRANLVKFSKCSSHFCSFCFSSSERSVGLGRIFTFISDYPTRNSVKHEKSSLCVFEYFVCL